MVHGLCLIEQAENEIPSSIPFGLAVLKPIFIDSNNDSPVVIGDTKVASSLAFN